MKAFLEQVPVCADSSFLVREFNVPYFEAPLHFHPVFELTLITEGKGKRFIGDHIDDFDIGDLVLIGPDLPHFYRCADKYYLNNPDLRSRAIIIQFNEDFLGSGFFFIPEMKQITLLLKHAKRGIAFYGETNRTIIQKMLEIREAEGFEKLTHLLSILHILSSSDEFELLSRQSMIGYNPKDNERMNKIYEYVITNFTKTINLKEVAERSNMSEAAFCRYFKKKTRKTFTTFLNEIRIAHACKLLLEDELNVAQICFKSGFENVSNFNRQFKSITNLNPLHYKEQFKIQPPNTTEYLTI